MKLIHVNVIDNNMENIRVEVEHKYRRFPLRVCVKADGNDWAITAQSLFNGYEDERGDIERFAMFQIGNAFK